MKTDEKGAVYARPFRYQVSAVYSRFDRFFDWCIHVDYLTVITNSALLSPPRLSFKDI